MPRPGARWLILWLPLAAACSELTRPAPGRNQMTARTARLPEAAPTANAQVYTAPAPSQPPAVAEGATISASHILVGYSGATRGRATATRTKAEARQRSDDLLARLRAGADFAELAREESDSPSAPRGGDLGSFTAQRMESTFAAAAFALAPGEISGVIDTPFGFHIIKRTK